MNDLTQRDFSSIPESSLTPDERRELRRRYDEFVGRLLTAREGPHEKKKAPAGGLKAWQPRHIARGNR